MLTLYQFNLLNEDEKGFVLFKDGVFVGDRMDYHFSVLLYQLYSFYVEVYYQQDLNEIQRLRTFSSTEQLEPYLERIQIEL